MRIAFRKALLGIAALLAINAASPRTLAQEAPGVGQLLDAQQAQLQRDFVKRLRAHALAAGKKGTPRYNAIIREGLTRLGAGLGQLTRGEFSDLRSIPPETIVAKPLALDRRANFTRELDSLLAAAEAGTRVIGGTPATSIRHFSETVALESEDSACTGVYIAAGAVLTAAHCVCDLKLRRGDSKDGKLIVFGSAIRDAIAKKVQIETDLTELFDSSYCESRNTPQAVCKTDLAVVRFTEPTPTFAGVVPFTPQPAKIARVVDFSATLARPEGPYVVVGFGATRVPGYGPYPIASSQGKNFGFVPKQQTCTTPPAAACSPASAEPYCFRGREIVLFDQRRSVDTCNGDSGGPVFIREEGASGGTRLLGITSRSASRQVECGAGGIYTFVQTDRVLKAWLKDRLHLDVQQ
jgi:hypothetical protein